MNRPEEIRSVLTDSETWFGFLAKEKHLVWALLGRKIRLKGPPRLLIAFGKCFRRSAPSSEGLSQANAACTHMK